jgi:DNA processing protein
LLKNELRVLLSGKILNKLEQFDSLEDIYRKTKPKDKTKNIDKQLRYIEENNIKITDYFSDDYPESLRNMENPPLVLYMRGEFKQTELPLAVVGTRYPSGYGERALKYLIPYLVKSGFSIISGMARGIDALAHKETLKNGGYTIAVLGSGIDVIYPEENKKVYENIAKNGCIISEFPLNTRPLRHNFPLRNRIIAGLSKGTLVVEADIKSGSLITARLTEELSKPVFAIPGEIFSKRSKGTNKLISQGAIIVNDIEAILSYFYIELKREIEKTKNETAQLSEDEKNILKVLEADMSIDELLLKTDLEISHLSDILFDLEIKGLIRHTPSDTYEKL